MATKRLFFSCIVLMALTGAGTALWGQSAGFAYVANQNSNNVSAYSIDGNTGALTPVAGSPFPAGRSLFSVTVDPTGRFAYVVNPTLPGFLFIGSVLAYSINGTTGALTLFGDFEARVSRPISVTVDPTGQFAYVGGAFGTVSVYSIDGTTGALTQGPVQELTNGPLFSVAVDPTGQFAYAVDTSNSVRAYTINGTTGGLTDVAGSPFPAGTQPFSVTVDPTGQFAYVANNGSANVSGYAINGIMGALTPVPGSPFPAGANNPRWLTVDPTGQFVYTANQEGNVSALAIDGTTGGLTPVAGSPFPAGSEPVSVTVDPTGQFVYVANHQGGIGVGNVSAYTIDGTTGALTEVPGSPFPAGSAPVSVTTTAGPLPPPPVF